MMGEVIRVSGKAPDVGEFLREAMLSQRFADVTLCCPGGQKFLAHRLVLSAASPYLQEVLLAHSKAAGYCEPITVILAEVEAPELAAILGFVYTGSATVSRPRLDAFLRAAEALHIRLPPVPVVMTCARESDCCKQEADAKEDVKISPKYLERYTSYDEPWYRHRRILSYNDSSIESKEPRTPESTEIIPPNSRSLVSTRYTSPPVAQCPAGPPCWSNNFEERRFDTVLEKEVRPAVAERDAIKRVDRLEKNLDFRSNGYESGKVCRDVYLSSVRSDLSEPRDTGKGNFDVGRTSEFHENDRTREVRLDGSFQGKDAGFQYASLGRTRSYEKPDYVQAGEDLSCGESCCRWRTTPRRHVANRVTASPWRQIVRPHHSPKIQPMVLQSHAEDTETGERIRSPEASPRPPVASHSPKEPSSVNSREDSVYVYEVPTSCELRLNDNANPLEPPASASSSVSQDFYKPPQIPFVPSPMVAAIANTRGNNETFFPAPTNTIPSVTTTRLQTGSNENASSAKKANYFPQTVPQTVPQTKPEISHPVSRLCDTIESNEKKDTFIHLEVKKPEEESRSDEKFAGRVFVNSDSNNNTAVIGNTEPAPQRGRTANGSQEDHRCDQCGKTFVTRASLKVHSRTHSGEKPFRCADCGKQFSQLRNYKYHRSVHEGTREFAATCPECGKYFNDRGYLSSHMKIHRNRKEYGCAECGKSFNQRVAYNMHVRIHTGVKPHQCEQCGKAFSRKMLLKQHLRTHSGERPYQCQVCQKAFADRSNMTLHTRLHSGLKPYQCTLCSKAFTKKHHLKTHLNYHTGTKPYSCPNCGLRFSQSSNMRTHFKKCTVNNPGGLKNIDSNSVVEPTKANAVRMIAATSTDTLTPPNSDQESSILTPISKTANAEVNVT